MRAVAALQAQVGKRAVGQLEGRACGCEQGVKLHRERAVGGGHTSAHLLRCRGFIGCTGLTCPGLVEHRACARVLNDIVKLMHGMPQCFRMLDRGEAVPLKHDMAEVPRLDLLARPGCTPMAVQRPAGMRDHRDLHIGWMR